MTTTPSASQTASQVASSVSHRAPSGTIVATSPTPQQDSSSTPVGAIAGGVIGGVAALALVVFLTFFFMRRRRQQPKSAELPADTLQGFEDTKYRSEVDGQHVYEMNEHGSKFPAVELNAAENPVELDGTDRARH
jgi:predicted PurR-regulated permease PerM